MECPVEIFEVDSNSCHFMGGSCGNCTKAARCFQLMGGCESISLQGKSLPQESMKKILKKVHEALGIR